MKSGMVTAGAVLLGTVLVCAVWWLSGPASAPATAASLHPFRAERPHRYGNPQAATTIVEFSDVECPFCSRVHPTIKRLVDESDGTINWEYRHLPLPFHQNAEYGAVVTECVSQAAGNDAVWDFLDTIFNTQAQLSTSHLNQVAQRYGLTSEDLAECVASTEIQNRLASDAETAAALGGSGTPYSVIVFPDGIMRPVSGALPYEQWQTLLEQS